eukprot:10719550-Alexandrium_andersonii.AAC.1
MASLDRRFCLQWPGVSRATECITVSCYIFLLDGRWHLQRISLTLLCTGMMPVHGMPLLPRGCVHRHDATHRVGCT